MYHYVLGSYVLREKLWTVGKVIENEKQEEVKRSEGGVRAPVKKTVISSKNELDF